MPSSRATLALLAAFVYGTSVLAVPLGNAYDLAERDYSDLAEFDARMFDMGLEEYYVREGEVTPPASPVVATPQTNGVPAHQHHHHHHHSPGHRHSQHPHSQGSAQKEFGSSAVTTPSPDASTPKLSTATRKPKGRLGRKGKVSKGRGRKGKAHKVQGRARKGKGKKDASAGGNPSPAPVTDANTTPGDAGPSVTGRDLFEVADEDLSSREPKNGKGGQVSKGKAGGSPPRGKGKGQKMVDAEAAPFVFS